jgi:hypothetical protein
VVVGEHVQLQEGLLVDVVVVVVVVVIVVLVLVVVVVVGVGNLDDEVDDLWFGGFDSVAALRR